MENLRIELDNQIFDVNIPGFWDEVPGHLYPSLARIYLRANEFMRIEDKRARTLSIFLDGALGAVLDLNEEQQYQLCRLVDWVFGEMTLSKNLIPSFEFGGVDYLGPAGDFSNIRFGEFVMAETYFSQYVDSEMSLSIVLDKLIAVLYRPSGLGSEYIDRSVNYRGDKRQKFNSNIVDHQAILFAELDLAIKDGVYLWYLTARERFFSYFKHIFNKRRSSQNKDNTTAVNWGWYGVFDDLLGEKGRTAESLEDEFVSVTLMSLERAQEKAKAIKRK